MIWKLVASDLDEEKDFQLAKYPMKYGEISMNTEKVYHVLIRGLEWIGTRRFRNLLFRIEKKIYPGKTLFNYHITSRENLYSYYSLLLYHGVLHTISIVFSLAAIGLGHRYLKQPLPILDVLMVLTIIVNIYCLLLQGYTYLRIRLLVKRQEADRQHRIATFVHQNRARAKETPDAMLPGSLQLCSRLSSVLENGGELTLTKKDFEALTMLAYVSSDMFLHAKERDEWDNNLDFLQQIETTTQRIRPFSRLERVVEKLAGWFGLPKKFRPMTETVIICTDVAANKAFSKLSTNMSAMRLKDRIAAGERIISDQENYNGLSKNTLPDT